MATVQFQHDYAGFLSIDTGMDNAAWSYSLNTITFPTYGGEVVQILSVYIDDLSLGGTVTSYAQIEAIWKYFSTYFAAATQGSNQNVPPQSVGGSAYNLKPMWFIYPERNWKFKIYPKAAPGFRYGREVVAPQWQVVCHVVDDSSGISSTESIADGIKSLAIQNIQAGFPPSSNVNSVDFNIIGQISPKYGDPNGDPFQTFDAGEAQAVQDVSKLADYYSTLIPAYMKGNLQDIITAAGSTPVLGKRATTNTNTVATPPQAHGPGKKYK